MQRLGATEQVRPVVAGANHGGLGSEVGETLQHLQFRLSVQRVLAGSRELNVEARWAFRLCRLDSLARQTGYTVLYIISMSRRRNGRNPP